MCAEPHGPNILPLDMVKAFQEYVPDSTIVETNILYRGVRYTIEDHRKTLATNAFTFSAVDIIDEEGDVAHGVVEQMPKDFGQWPMQDYLMKLLADSGMLLF